MARFAEDTSVSVEKSRAEIERLIIRYGATSTAFLNAPGRAVIVFEAKDRKIMFELPLPDINNKKFLKDGRGTVRRPAKRHEAWEKACRQCWRALALVIKAKLEAVASGITTFEDEFLSHIVMWDGRTVGAHIKPKIADWYASGDILPLLAPPNPTATMEK